MSFTPNIQLRGNIHLACRPFRHTLDYYYETKITRTISITEIIYLNIINRGGPQENIPCMTMWAKFFHFPPLLPHHLSYPSQFYLNRQFWSLLKFEPYLNTVLANWNNCFLYSIHWNNFQMHPYSNPHTWYIVWSLWTVFYVMSVWLYTIFFNYSFSNVLTGK